MPNTHERVEYFKRLFHSFDLLRADCNQLFLLTTKFEKIEKQYIEKYHGDLIYKRIAIVSSYTTHHIAKAIKLLLYTHNISPIFYISSSTNLELELLDQNSAVYRFKPDILIILPHQQDIKQFPQLFVSDEEIAAWTRQRVNFYNTIWEHAFKNGITQVLQSVFVLPVERVLGNLEANCAFSRTNCLRHLNMELAKNRPLAVTLMDFDYLASLFGKEKWFDNANYYLSKRGFSYEALPLVALSAVQLINASLGKIRKCLVLDLDNTLWGGTIGDDGVDGINLNPNDPIGEAYIAFQGYLKRLKDRGVILAVCSKNEDSLARSPFKKHHGMKLQIADIACFTANWDDKATNLARIAKQLNIGIDSLVFFDDNPAERELVKQNLPQIAVVDVSDDPSNYISDLEKGMYFDWLQLTTEDAERNNSYITNSERDLLLKQSIDYPSYLKSLEMRASIAVASEKDVPRLAQLINKTNQFNLTVRRYTETELIGKLNIPSTFLLRVDLKDRFSGFGIVSCLIVEKQGHALIINTWVMSCRVFKRGLEILVMNYLKEFAKVHECGVVSCQYLPTEKNKLTRDSLLDLGFAETDKNTFEIDIRKSEEMHHCIQMEEYCGH